MMHMEISVLKTEVGLILCLCKKILVGVNKLSGCSTSPVVGLLFPFFELFGMLLTGLKCKIKNFLEKISQGSS